MDLGKETFLFVKGWFSIDGVFDRWRWEQDTYLTNFLVYWDGKGRNGV